MTPEEFASALKRKLAEVVPAAADQSALLPEAAIETLKEVAARYAAGCPFKAGDIVTPRHGYNVQGAGQPHVVVEIPSEPVRNFGSLDDPADTSSHAFGRRFDMRVAGLHHGALVAHWVESWAYELYEVAEA